jgi:hypothetical protein
MWERRRREKESAYAGPPWIFRGSGPAEDQKNSDLGSGYVTLHIQSYDYFKLGLLTNPKLGM